MIATRMDYVALVQSAPNARWREWAQKRLEEYDKRGHMPLSSRFGVAVELLMDAYVMLNNQSDIAKRIEEFIASVHPAECVELPGQSQILALADELERELDSKEPLSLKMSTGRAIVDALRKWVAEYPK